MKVTLNPQDQGQQVEDPWEEVLGTPCLFSASPGSCSSGTSHTTANLRIHSLAAATLQVSSLQRERGHVRQGL